MTPITLDINYDILRSTESIQTTISKYSDINVLVSDARDKEFATVNSLPKMRPDAIQSPLEIEASTPLTSGQIEVQTNMVLQKLDLYFTLDKAATMDGSCMYKTFSINIERLMAKG